MALASIHLGLAAQLDSGGVRGVSKDGPMHGTPRNPSPHSRGKRLHASLAFTAGLVAFLFAFVAALGWALALTSGFAFGVLLALVVTRSPGNAVGSMDWVRHRGFEIGIGMLLLVATGFPLHGFGSICIEGGTTVGFPKTFYSQCNEVGPGGPVGAAHLELTGLLVDATLWYLVAVAVLAWVKGATGGRVLKGSHETQADRR